MRDHRQGGFSLIELLVVAGVFALMVLMVDAFFSIANRSAHTAELAADVAQNGRVAIERLTREARFSSASNASVSSTGCSGMASPPTTTLCIETGGGWMAFKTARLQTDERVFCLDVASSNDDLYNAGCGAPLTGSYDPVWQAWIVYGVDGNGDLRRSVQVPATSAPSVPTSSNGTIIATSVSSFTASLSGNVLSMTLELSATEKVQGSNLPTQRISLTGETFVRD